MDTRTFTRESKILLTDLRAGRNTVANLQKYITMISSSFTDYGIMKVALNLHTRREEDKKLSDDSVLMNIIKEAAEIGMPDTPEKKARIRKLITELSGVRQQITAEMRAITAFVDKLTMHESVLNRKIAANTEEIEIPDAGMVERNVEQFIFSDKDRVGVNLRIQQVIAQLPVRMTRQRFYDVIARSVALYKGGERSVAEDFVDSVRDVAGITEIDGSSLKHYKKLQDVLTKTLERLDSIDYLTVSADEVEKAGSAIEEAAEMLSGLSSDLMQKQEIVNDQLILLYTSPYAAAEYQDARFSGALELLRKIVSDKELEPEELVDRLAALEGMQEEAYERLTVLEADLDILAAKMDKPTASDLRSADLLTSSSLFTDLDKMLSLAEEEREMADDALIKGLTESLIADFESMFSGMDKLKRRGTMAVVLGHVPVFFDSRKEITDYIAYSLEHCGDDRELGAVWELLQTVIG